MKGLQKFLFGGFIGAIVGFLIAPKRAQQVRDALFSRESKGSLPQSFLKALTTGPSPSQEAPLPLAAPVVPAYAPEPPALAPSPAPAQQPEPAAPLVADQPAAQSAPLAPTGAVCAALDSEPWPEEEQAGLTRTPEVATLPPEVVSEEESVDLAEPETELADEAEEMELVEAAAPEGAEEPQAEAPEVAAVPKAVDSEPWPEEERAGLTLVPEAEPVEAASPEEAMAPVAPLEFAPAAAPEVEAVPEVAPVPETVPEAAPRITVVPEPDVVEEPTPVAAAPPAPEVATEVDLRARIEETRRRIREEMERPFRIAAGETDEEFEVGFAEEQVAAVQAEAVPPEAAAPAEEQAAEALIPPQDGESGFDYDEMRRRIEETRQRLKSKAFDAMMSGETSLLARDQDGKVVPDAPKVSLDRDVDQTIESGLAEEDL